MAKTGTNIDICYIISHGFAARMLLQTGLILKLAQAGKSIAIITPDAEDSNLKPLTEHPLIHVFDPNINQTIWDDDYNVKRRYYLEDIKGNPVFWEKHIHSIFYTDSKHPWKRIRPFIYYPIYLLIPYFPSIRKRFKAKEDKYLKSEKASQLLEKINPKVVVSTYPVNFLEAKFMFAAKKQGRRTLIHLLSWDNVTSKGIFPIIPDEFIAWGRIMYEELKEYYHLDDEQLQVCGVPHFDHHIKIKEIGIYKDLIMDLGLNPDKPYLFVAMSSPRFAPYEIDIVEWLSNAIHDDVFGKDLQLVVRPHPQNVQGSMSDKRWIGRLDKLKSNRVAIDYPTLIKSNVRWSMAQSDMDHLSKLLLGCSICLNSGSTVSIDSLIMDKPVILTSFDGDKKLNYWKSARRLVDYTHLKKLTNLGGVDIVHSYESLKKSISTYIQNPQHNIEGRRHALLSECYKNDGNATNRVVQAMMNILQRVEKINE